MYPGPSGEVVPVGDGVVGGDGLTYLPVALDTGARMLVIGNNLLPGLGLRPQGNDIRTLRDWLKLSAMFGLRQGTGDWKLETLTGDVEDISTADVLEWWTDMDYSNPRQLSVKYDKAAYYPALRALTLEGEPESYDASSVICSAPDAAHVYAWQGLVGAPVLGRFFVRHRVTVSTLKLMDKTGGLHRYGFERARVGVLLRVTTDLERAILTAEYADVGGISAQGF